MYPGNGGGGGATGSMTSDGAGISNIREVFKFSILKFLLKVLKCTQNHNFGCSFRFKFDNEIREICGFSKATYNQVS